MTDWNEHDKSLIDRARGGYEPNESDRRRVRSALVGQLGVASGLTVTTSVGTSVASTSVVAGATSAMLSGGATAGTTVGATALGGSAIAATKVLLAVAVSFGLGVAGLTTYRAVSGIRAAHPIEVRASVDIPTPARVAAARSPAEPAVALAPLPSPALLSSLPPAVSNVAAALPEVHTPGLVHERSAAVPPAAEVPLPATKATAPTGAFAEPTLPAEPIAATTLEAETRLVREGVAQLHAGNPAAALALFDQHAAEYPIGVLAEERAAERVIALCDLGRASEAHAAADAFVSSHPRSPLAERVRASCAGQSIP